MRVSVSFCENVKPPPTDEKNKTKLINVFMTPPGTLSFLRFSPRTHTPSKKNTHTKIIPEANKEN